MKVAGWFILSVYKAGELSILPLLDCQYCDVGRDHLPTTPSGREFSGKAYAMIAAWKWLPVARMGRAHAGWQPIRRSRDLAILWARHFALALAIGVDPARKAVPNHASCYLPAWSNGYRRAHWRCLPQRGAQVTFVEFLR